MTINYDFLCQEISLLEFNKRVLYQAYDENIPLLERLKFLCILSSNLDEFFEVKVARLKRLTIEKPNVPIFNKQLPQDIFLEVHDKAKNLINEQYLLLVQTILPLLRKEKICFYHVDELNEQHKTWIEQYFHTKIKPVITPIGLDPTHPFPQVYNKSLNFIVELDGQDAFGRLTNLAIVQAPKILPVVIALPSKISNGKNIFVFLSSIISSHIQAVFLGMKVKSCNQFRITRNSRLLIDEDEVKNLRFTIEMELQKRHYGQPVRMEVNTNCNQYIVQFLLDQFKLQKNELYKIEDPINLSKLMFVHDLINRDDLKYNKIIPLYPVEFRKNQSIISILNKKDILLHHPYQSFDHVINFIEQSATDNDVIAIKITFYRIGNKSDLINALIKAALAKKEVTVVVELMARFDEEANVNWAEQLEHVGVHVVYGVFGYKVHAKMALVIKKEKNKLKRYCHLSTGNYHQGTSRLYTDCAIMTSDEQITSDINDIFTQITGLGKAMKLKKLYQSPFTLHKMILQSIDIEIENKKNNKKALIIAKMNSLVEPIIIKKLYKASLAGVEIILIVRGMCCLKPQIPGLSENIKVISIIGRLLEHSRIFYFYNSSKEDLYISSADWMNRNFFHRIEICIPIQNIQHKQKIIKECLLFALKDNTSAWEMNCDGTYTKIKPQKTETPFNVQEFLLNKYKMQC